MQKCNCDMIEMAENDIELIESLMDKLLAYTNCKKIHNDSIYYKAAIFDCLCFLRDEIACINSQIMSLKEDLPFY